MIYSIILSEDNVLTSKRKAADLLDGYVEISKKFYEKINLGDVLDISEEEIIEKAEPEPEPLTEIDYLKKDNENLKRENAILSDKVDNLKEGLFELTMLTLGGGD